MRDGSEERRLIVVLACKCICHFVKLCRDASQLFRAMHGNTCSLVAARKVFDYIADFKDWSESDRSQPDQHDRCAHKKRSAYAETDSVTHLIPSFGLLQGCVRLLNVDVDKPPQSRERVVESTAIGLQASLPRLRKINIEELFCVV